MVTGTGDRRPVYRWFGLFPTKWSALYFVFLVGIATCLAGLFISYTLLTRSNYILHGVTIGGVQVGNQTRSEAWNTLRANYFVRSVPLVANGEIWTSPLMSELGINLDIHEAVNTAYDQGRNHFPLIGMFAILNIKTDIPPTYTTDWPIAEGYLNAIAKEITIPPQNATLVYSEGRFAVSPPVAGRQLDVAMTIAQWQTAAQVGETFATAGMQLPLVTVPIQPPVADLTPFLEQANQMLARPIYIEAYDPVLNESVPIELSAETWASFLTFDLVDNQLIIKGDPEQIATHLRAFNDTQQNRYVETTDAFTIANGIELGQSSLSLRMLHPQIVHTVQSGESIASIGNLYGIPYPWIQAINPNAETLAVGQQITIPSVDEMLPLPVVRNKRVIVSISQQYMWAYENGGVKWEWPVSTGIADSPTSPGVFQIQSHELEAYGGAWDLYMPNFMGVYLPAPGLELMNGFHGFPTRDGTNLLWTNSLGQPATYGCILIDNTNMALFYDWAEDGVVVEIQP